MQLRSFTSDVMKPRRFFDPPRTRSRVVRRHWRDARFAVPVEVMPRALGWTLEQLRKRLGRSAAWVAQRAKVGQQTVRDLEQGLFPNYAFTKVDAVARVLHGDLARTERLAHRFLWHDYLREARLHGSEPGWRYVFPWSKKRTTLPRLRHPA